MAPRINKRLGKNALVSTPLKNIKPNQVFKDRFPNEWRMKRGKFCVLGLEKISESHTNLLLTHQDFSNEVFRCKPGVARLEKVGPPNQFFTAPTLAQNKETHEESEDEPEIEDNAHTPDPEQSNQNNSWDWENFRDDMPDDYRGAAPKNDASMRNANTSNNPIYYFDKFMIWGYVETEIIPATNRILQEQNFQLVSIGEFKRYIGIWITASLNPGYQQLDFWVCLSSRPRDMYWNPPYFGELMSKTRFIQIHSALRLRNEQPPVNYRDRFWQVRELIRAFNTLMELSFFSSWLVCVDESMVIFSNSFCPGWMNVKRKPHPFGNEYHTIACCQTHIIFYIEIVEGKDTPVAGPNSTKDMEEEMGKCPSLVCRMTRTIWGSGRVVLLDSGFGYLNCLGQLRRKGLFSTTVIKKKQHWPRGVDGDKILMNMSNKNVGSCLVQRGTNNELFPNINFWIGAMADSKHISIMANTWSTTHETGHKRKRRVGNSLIEISYGEYMHWYYYGRHAVDDNNNNRQGSLPFEETYATKRWDLRQLGFIIALTLTNAQLAYNHFNRLAKKETLVTKAEFLRSIGRTLIHNEHYESQIFSENESQRMKTRHLPLGACLNTMRAHYQGPHGHELCRLEAYHGKWNGTEFPRRTTRYGKCQCAMRCGRETRTFCFCNFAIMMCSTCHGLHLAEKSKGNLDV